MAPRGGVDAEPEEREKKRIEKRKDGYDHQAIDREGAELAEK